MSIPTKSPLKRAIEKAELRQGIPADEYAMRIAIAKWWLEEYKEECRKRWVFELEKKRRSDLEKRMAKDGYFYA